MVRRIEGLHAVLVAATAAAGWATGALAPASVLLGGALIGASTLLTGLGLHWLLGGRRRRLAIGFLFAKLAGFMAILALVVLGLGVPVDGLAFAAGVTCFPLAALGEALGVCGRAGAEVGRG